MWVTFAVQGDATPTAAHRFPSGRAAADRGELAVFVGGAVVFAVRNSAVASRARLAPFVLCHAMTTDRLTWPLRP